MSVAAQKWAWEQHLPDRPKFVLVTMADQADSRTGHVCYQRTDAAFFVDKCNISRRSFYRCVAALVRNGYLKRESGRGKGQETRYWLCLDRAVTPPEAWSWELDIADEGLTQDVAESANMALQESEFESARVGTYGVPSVAQQDSFESPKNLTKGLPKGRKTDFSKEAQNIERGVTEGLGVFKRVSREGRAIAVLCEVIGKFDFFERVYCRQQVVYYSGEITPQLLALAQAPPRSGWPRLNGQQAAAWFALAVKTFSNLRITLRAGARAPWPWPPSKDGAVYTGTDPPSSEWMTREDRDSAANLKRC